MRTRAHSRSTALKQKGADWHCGQASKVRENAKNCWLAEAFDSGRVFYHHEALRSCRVAFQSQHYCVATPTSVRFRSTLRLQTSQASAASSMQRITYHRGRSGISLHSAWLMGHDVDRAPSRHGHSCVLHTRLLNTAFPRNTRGAWSAPSRTSIARARDGKNGTDKELGNKRGSSGFD